MDRNEDNPYAPPQSTLIGSEQIDPILHARLESARSGLRRSLVSLVLYGLLIGIGIWVAVFAERDLVADMLSIFIWFPAWLIGLSALWRIWAAVETVLALRVIVFIASLYSPLAIVGLLIHFVVGAWFVRMHGAPLRLFRRGLPKAAVA